MGRLAMFALMFLITWVGSLVVKSDATPLAVVVPMANGVGKDKVLERVERDIKQSRKPEITKLNVRSAVTSRFSSTTVTSVLKNHAEEAAEAVFVIRLPEEAFVANFSLKINGLVYPAGIEEKEVAQRVYAEAVERGWSGAHVHQQSEHVNNFKVSVNVAKKNSVTFELIYQEMLVRKKGYFEHRTSIRPGQIVKNINMQVIITEIQGLTEVNTSWVKDQNNGEKITKHGVGDLKLNPRNTRAIIEYAPTVEEQRQERKDGIQGDFVIRYDVEHPTSGGELHVVNGYFVHYFSPEGLSVVRKNVVFVIDVSGSMGGLKMEQTKEAMATILDELREMDYFNIVTFANSPIIFGSKRMYQNTLLQATSANIRRAKVYVSKLKAAGGTDLHGGFLKGIKLLQKFTKTASDNSTGVSMVITLTDGMPTFGNTNLNKIERDVEKAVNGKCSLFNLGFGDDVDYPFLEKLSLRNRGLARKVYADSEASLQLEGFFDEIATPLLYNVVFNYPEDRVETNSLTQITFPNYFKGTELVVTGKIKSTNIRNEVLQMTIAANSVDVPLEFPLTVNIQGELLNKYTVDDFAQRLWAYLSIKELLRRRSISNIQSEKDVLKEQALQLSLKYHFVTPLTSLVVVKPEYIESKPMEEDSSHIGKATSPIYLAGNATLPIPVYSAAGDLDEATIQISRVLQDAPYLGANYRSDYRCGAKFKAPNGKDAICPDRCCSNSYWCGDTSSHCSCKTCIDYRNQPTKPTPTTLPPTTTLLPTTTLPPRVGDTHFLVKIPQSNMYVCFNITGQPGDIYRLISDPKQGISVTGELSEKRYAVKQRYEEASFLRKVNIAIGNRTIVVVPSQVTFDENIVRWKNTAQFGAQNLSIRIRGDQLRVMIGTEITLIVTRLTYQRFYYFGVYIHDGSGFSNKAHGLIGQFQNSAMSLATGGRNNRQFRSTTLNVNSRQVPVVSRYADEPGLSRNTRRQCWFADDNGAGLIDGNYIDYLE